MNDSIEIFDDWILDTPTTGCRSSRARFEFIGDWIIWHVEVVKEFVMAQRPTSLAFKYNISFQNVFWITSDKSVHKTEYGTRPFS